MLNGWWPFTINLQFIKFGSHRSRGSGDISFFISHVSSCGHVIIGSSLLSVVVIRLAEVEIWSILIFNVRIRMHMIILLQSVTIQSRSLLWHISYYKVRQNNFITKCDRLLLQSVSGIVKCDRLYLQSASGIIRCVSYYKVRRNIVAQNKLVQSLFLNKVAGLRPEFCKIFKKSFLQNISGQLLLMTFPGVI